MKNKGAKILERVIAQAPSRSRLDYADLRVCELQKEQIRLKNGHIAGLSNEETSGYGIRVLLDGFWGFSSHYGWSETEIDATIRDAYRFAVFAGQIAKKNHLEPEPFTKEKSYRAHWKSPCVIDPFAVPLPEKLSVLRTWHETPEGFA